MPTGQPCSAAICSGCGMNGRHRHLGPGMQQMAGSLQALAAHLQIGTDPRQQLPQQRQEQQMRQQQQQQMQRQQRLRNGRPLKAWPSFQRAQPSRQRCWA